MKYFCYGLGDFSINKFNTPTKVNKEINKLNNGLWACERNEVYSDWFVLTLAFPMLVNNPQIKGFEIELCQNVKLLELSLLNYKKYTDDEGILIFEKLKKYDAILFRKDLITKIKTFESYYFECIQILNFNNMKITPVKMDLNYILSDKFKINSLKKISSVIKHVQNTIT